MSLFLGGVAIYSYWTSISIAGLLGFGFCASGLFRLTSLPMRLCFLGKWQYRLIHHHISGVQPPRFTLIFSVLPMMSTTPRRFVSISESGQDRTEL
ncbi:hypothetical protein BDQ17DRAFT_1347357, partial [Cyathus striatus]